MPHGLIATRVGGEEFSDKTWPAVTPPTEEQVKKEISPREKGKRSSKKSEKRHPIETSPAFQPYQSRAALYAMGKSAYSSHGQRIVAGCHLMQSASDLFLGWTEGQAGRQYYIRQLKDMKIKPLVELFTPGVMLQYAEFCGWTLAHAARPLRRACQD